jgi:hypothetical protein
MVCLINDFAKVWQGIESLEFYKRLYFKLEILYLERGVSNVNCPNRRHIPNALLQCRAIIFSS